MSRQIHIQYSDSATTRWLIILRETQKEWKGHIHSSYSRFLSFSSYLWLLLHISTPDKQYDHNYRPPSHANYFTRLRKQHAFRFVFIISFYICHVISLKWVKCQGVEGKHSSLGCRPFHDSTPARLEWVQQVGTNRHRRQMLDDLWMRYK